jgi:hypothetical protein
MAMIIGDLFQADGTCAVASFVCLRLALIIKKLVEMLQNPDALLGQEQAC